MKLVCKNCNYRFESGFDKIEKKCPYCGKKGVIEEPDAETLINE